MPYTDPERQKQAQHEAYLRSKEKVRDRVVQTRRANREWLISYKESHPCVDCGNFYLAFVMDFDHCRGIKLKEVATLIRGASLATVQAEIAKCDLVCANCHRLRTWLRQTES